MAANHRLRRSADLHRTPRVVVVRRPLILAAVGEGDSDIVLLEGLLSR